MTSYNITYSNVDNFPKVESHNDAAFGYEERINKTFPNFQTDGSQKIQYRLNDFGFRSDESYESLLRGDDNYILCLGCSHTEGIGVDVKERWSEKLGLKMGYKVMNLGLTSGSEKLAEYFYFRLMFTHRARLPKFTFCLQPPNRRYTVMDDRRITFLQDFNWKTDANDGKLIYRSIAENKDYICIDNFDKDSYEGPHPLDFVYYTQSQGWKAICKSENIVNFDWDKFGEEHPKGADNMHFGSRWHTIIADEMYRLWDNKTNYAI